MRLSNLSLKTISAIISVLVMVCFVGSYLTIKYLGSYQDARQQVEVIQQAEKRRVKVALEMSQEIIDNPLLDYAVWDRTAEYIANQNPEFLHEDLNDHTFEALKIEGIILFGPLGDFVWGERYSLSEHHIVPLSNYMQRAAKLIKYAERLPDDKPAFYNQFMVIEEQPHMMAIARVCNSAGDDCAKGYIVMAKRLTRGYFQRLNLSTGLTLQHQVLEAGVSPDEQDSRSYLDYIDPVSEQRWRVEVLHSVQPPSFVSMNEGIALTLLAFFMFGFNFYLARAITRPIDRANALLTEAGKGQTELDESSFTSLELRAFARNIRQVITELDVQRRLLQQESNQDPLTQLANRRRLENFLLDKLDNNQRYVSLFLIDVDHFKLLNDNYGHSRGDEVLKQVAQAYSFLPLDGDVLVARYGGEEFCIVCVTEQEADLAVQAMRLVTAIRNLALEHRFSPTAAVVTVSVGGVQMKAAQQEDYRRLVNHADKSLYLAKKNGRDRSCVETIVARRKSVRLG